MMIRLCTSWMCYMERGYGQSIQPQFSGHVLGRLWRRCSAPENQLDRALEAGAASITVSSAMQSAHCHAGHPGTSSAYLVSTEQKPVADDRILPSIDIREQISQAALIGLLPIIIPLPGYRETAVYRRVSGGFAVHDWIDAHEFRLVIGEVAQHLDRHVVVVGTCFSDRRF